jgi:proteic killer suppression protein
MVFMINSIRHKGLRRFFEAGTTKGIQASHERRLQLMLTALDTAATIDDMDIPGYRLHPLKGKMKGRWSISVSGQWRLTFEFNSGNVELLDYEDYH